MVLGDLLDRLAEAAGLSSATSEIIVMLLAMLLIVIGIAIVMVVLFGKWARTIDAGESRLLPTLVEDVLDADLREIYERTLMLDALVAEYFSGLADATGTELGRRVRKFLVRVQASRFAARRQTGRQHRRGEPSEMEARLEEVDMLVGDAVERLGADQDSSSSADDAARLLEELGDKL